MPVNPGERFPEPSRSAKAVVAVTSALSRHQIALAIVLAFVLGVLFGAK